MNATYLLLISPILHYISKKQGTFRNLIIATKFKLVFEFHRIIIYMQLVHCYYRKLNLYSTEARVRTLHELATFAYYEENFSRLLVLNYWILYVYNSCYVWNIPLYPNLKSFAQNIFYTQNLCGYCKCGTYFLINKCQMINNDSVPNGISH